MMILKYATDATATFEIDVKLRRISEILIQHTENESFEKKIRGKFWTTADIK